MALSAKVEGMVPKLSLRITFSAGLLALVASLTPSHSQDVVEAVTEPVGVVKTRLAANSDTFVSLSFPRPSLTGGTVQGVNGQQITLSIPSPLAPQGLVYVEGSQPNTYYLQMKSGAAAGHYATINANTESAVVTEFEPDILAMLQPGDRAEIVPYWTLGTLFPPEDAGESFVPSTSNLQSTRRTEILIPNVGFLGVNKSTSAIYFYNGYWRRVGAVGPNRKDDVLLPDSYFVVRGNNFSGDRELVMSGTVTSDHVLPITTWTSTNDNLIGLPIPKSFTPNSLGLVQQGIFTPSPSNLQSARRDVLLAFFPLTEGQTARNRSASAIYFYNGFWRRVGDVGSDQGDIPFPSGTVFILRKTASTSPSVADWNLSL